MEPEKLGPFKIGRVLGRGGMGAVYEGTHETDDSTVALKVLTASLDEESEDRIRFETEIETLKRLHHPNIVRLTGFGEEQGRLYYVMEFVDGASLQQELRKKRIFQWQEAAKIGLEICQALRHAHDRGVIHRDIKPANILLDREGNVKLSDFGIARFFGSQQITDIHSIIGTLEYMSPEQTLAQPISTVSDLYSLGCVLYVLLIGKPPFPARSLPELLRKHQNAAPIPIRSTRHDVPEELTLIIDELLQIRPEDRPRNALLVIKQLQSLLQAMVENSTDIKVVPMPSSPDDVPLQKNVDPNSVRAPERISLLDDTVTSSAVLLHEEISLQESLVSLSKSSTRFTAVTSSDFDPYEAKEPQRPVFSLPTVLASTTLMIVGLVVYYLLQPVPPDVLFSRITVKVRECAIEGYSLAQLRSAQHDIRQFLSMYPNDPSAEQVRVFQDELDLQEHERRLERRMQASASQSLSPVERKYIEILSMSPHNPEQTIDKLRAFIDVFRTVQSASEESVSPYRYTSSPVEICVELARRRLKKLEQEVGEINEEQEYVLRRRLDEAADLDSKDSQRAEEIRRGIIELYQDHRWARELLEEVKRHLVQQRKEESVVLE